MTRGKRIFHECFIVDALARVAPVACKYREDIRQMGFSAQRL